MSATPMITPTMERCEQESEKSSVQSPATNTVSELAPKFAFRPRLEYFPVAFFGSVMGLVGLSVAWRLAETRFGAPAWISQTIGNISILDFVVLIIAFGVKMVTAFPVIRNEFRHPIIGNLFGTLFISLLLLPIVIAPSSLDIARAMWIIGAIAMTIFAWHIFSRWLTDRQQVAHATPAWIIPLVGLLDIPLALPDLGLPNLHGVMVFAMASGLFFAVPIFTLIFSRLVFEPPMPDALKPTLMMLVVPFAVGYSTYTVTTGQNDIFSESLYMLTLFVLAVVVGLLRNLVTRHSFRIVWWGVSFPLAACSIATLRFADTAPGTATNLIALVVLALASIVIAGLFIRTIIGVVKGEMRALCG